MALGKITKTLVERLRPGELIWDAGHREVVKGFGCRRQRRDCFYLLRYRITGRQRFITIGRHGSPWTPDTARSEAKRLLGLVASRTDPALERERAAETFEAEVKRYLEYKRPLLRPRSYQQTEYHLMRQSKPLHPSALTEIDRRALALRLSDIETASGPITRNRVRSSLSAFFTWAMHEGLVEANPVAGTAKAVVENGRDRVLSDVELGKLWNTLSQTTKALSKSRGKSQGFADLLRLLMLTGQRREEIAGLRWTEVDLDRRLIVLPPERVKNKRQHELPLSPQALALIDRQPHSGEFVFGQVRWGWAERKIGLDKRLGFKQPWRLHDIRRSVATGMADKLGVLPHIIEAILNHVSGHKGGVAGIYNRAKYEAAMREALDRWAKHIEEITA